MCLGEDKPMLKRIRVYLIIPFHILPIWMNVDFSGLLNYV